MVHARGTQRLSLEDFPPSRVAVNVNISENEHKMQGQQIYTKLQSGYLTEEIYLFPTCYPLLIYPIFSLKLEPPPRRR